jgi:hypothetical protein
MVFRSSNRTKYHLYVDFKVPQNKMAWIETQKSRTKRQVLHRIPNPYSIASVRSSAICRQWFRVLGYPASKALPPRCPTQTLNLWLSTSPEAIYIFKMKRNTSRLNTGRALCNVHAKCFFYGTCYQLAAHTASAGSMLFMFRLHRDVEIKVRLVVGKDLTKKSLKVRKRLV